MQLDTWRAPPGDRIPNNPRFPVLIYHGVDAAAAGADAARELFARHGWGGSWVDGVFGFHHFHSTSHEALAVVSGRATLELGGPIEDRDVPETMLPQFDRGPDPTEPGADDHDPQVAGGAHNLNLCVQCQRATPSPPTASSGGGPSAAIRSRAASTSPGSSPRSRS